MFTHEFTFSSIYIFLTLYKNLCLLLFLTCLIWVVFDKITYWAILAYFDTNKSLGGSHQLMLMFGKLAGWKLKQFIVMNKLFLNKLLIVRDLKSAGQTNLLNSAGPISHYNQLSATSYQPFSEHPLRFKYI